jgi:predicted RNA-binding Zn-ribbon protein involved in translation (DUF1610 family)
VTTIKASCPNCGEVKLTAEDVSLVVCSNSPLSYYAFICPSCREEVRKPADDHIICMLLSGGIRAQVWQLPAEALEPKTGSALSYDELLEFALELADNDLLIARISGQVT